MATIWKRPECIREAMAIGHDPSPGRETKGNAPDGAKRQRGHGHFMHTTTRTGPETRRQGVTLWRRETEAMCHRKGLERKRVEEGGWNEEYGEGKVSRLSLCLSLSLSQNS